ncbi:MAG: nucleotidyl transferase AbiEii/AbiGii toxin family protein [Anaerolineae bacterium]
METRLLTQSARDGVSLVRLRKMVAFDRFLARLLVAQPEHWLLKGGLALQLRLGNRARTTKDIDISLELSRQNVGRALTAAAARDLGDWFSFVVRQESDPLPGLAGGGWRFAVTGLVDSRLFESFHIDVGLADTVLEPADALTTPALLAFAGIAPLTVPCYPLSQHLAEKVHAYSKPPDSGVNTRVKDLVDILLIAEIGAMTAPTLRAAIRATFAAQGSGEPPASLPDPPVVWAAKYRSLALGCGLAATNLPQGLAQARAFLDPVLNNTTQGIWLPEQHIWR